MRQAASNRSRNAGSADKASTRTGQVFAESLRTRAVELGISNSEAARRSGLGERRFGHYTTGEREPDLGTLVRIAEALSTTPDALLGIAERSSASPRERLLARLQSAANGLSDDHLELIVVQVEAVSARPSPKRPTSKIK